MDMLYLESQQRGEVVCVQRRCPAVPCAHPAPDGCACPVCDGCRFTGRDCFNGERFTHPTDHCQRCSCLNGGVVCVAGSCPAVSCRRPVRPPGECCPVCSGVCQHEGREPRSGSTFSPAHDPCSSCTCLNEVVSCQKRPCPVQCSHPVPSEGCCPTCDSCLYQGLVHVHRHTFSAPSDPCQRCTCVRGTVTTIRVPGECCPVLQRGEVVCVQRRCPAVPCAHPVPDGCACPVCDGCRFTGRDCFNGERFTHPTDHCQRCSCLNGGVVCVARSCPAVSCRRPVRPPGECCPVCSGVCQHEGREPRSGSTFSPAHDPCSSCTCLNEVVSCQKRPCPVQCSHPVPSEGCCPTCDSCLYQGHVHVHRHTFSAPSDPCQRCTCVRGTDGEVRCASPGCPNMPCMHQVQDPGACCPRCRGCVYDGVEHAEGSSWFADATACVSCMCAGGVTTCSEIRCLSPCVSTIRVPGECCPVCADCLFEGRVYSPTDSFHPAGDPCQICTCEVMPDGEQHLRCYRKQCPSLVDCPPNNILFSGSDSCCPVCAQPLSNCTATLIGNEVLATDDPCFTCQCKDLTWTCLHQNCLPLTCAPSKQLTVPDSCCPVCEASGVSCTYQGALYQPDEQWPVDECTTCTCVSGDVHCDTERCPPLACSPTEMPAVVPGVCCPHCLPRPATCIAFGDPHYRTFDGRMLHFQGTCTYILAQDCQGGDFSIHVTNDDRGRKGVSWTKEVTVFIGDLSVQLLQDWVVKVLWSGRSHLEVSVPGSYRKHTHALSSCRPGEDVDPCKEAGYQVRKGANSRCKVLKSAAFQPCHRVVPPEPWHGACVYDLCACGANAEECLGFVFDECGPPCPVTCLNVDVPLGVVESHCFKPCVPGCQCPAGLVLHSNYCITPDKCPKIIHGNSSVLHGSL
ncbi:hypothetical protein CRUP_007621 [Coryphaenoides rupestris]|nr:hypothetical protein CRUP_007621 [Coryphaenoides rupestris]